MKPKAADWHYDMYQKQGMWLKISLGLNGALLLGLLIASLTILIMQPLQKNVPYLYAFNQATGEVTTLGQLQPNKITQNWQMTRFFLLHYVIYRESYDSDSYYYQFNRAMHMSSTAVADALNTAEIHTNPKSPFNVYGKDKFISVKVLSIAQLAADTADVRFKKILTDKNSGEQKISQCEAIIKFAYQPKITTQHNLDYDPLGFKVTYYQTTQVTI